MDSSAVPKYKLLDLCRCCLNATNAGNIFAELTTGRSEGVEDMLKETFNIELYRPECQSRPFICDACASKLQQARAFKLMVLQSEQTFAMRLTRFSNDNIQTDIVSDTMKTECVVVTDDFEFDERCDHSSQEDEPLSLMKKDIEGDLQSSGDSCHTNTQKIVCKPSPKSGGGKVKKKSRSAGDTKKEKEDWRQIRERRGNGPILRENSLKLVENSTVCVFQWYKSKYTCFCCKQPFTDIHTLRKHTTTEHTLRNIEKKIIKQQNQMVKVEISVLNCKLCNQSLVSLQTLREHLSSVHAFEFRLEEDLLIPFKIEESLECQICFEKFTLFRLLNIHMNKHYQNQVCHICGASFSNLKFLNLHKTRLHRTLNCKECDIEFGSKTDKRNHDVSVHKLKITRKMRFPCPHCDERFVQENFKVLHLVEKHGLKKPEFRCSVCPKTFVTKSLCNNHVKNVHMKERRFGCDVCQQRFYSKSAVSRHQLTHSAEKRFSCSLCGTRFATKDAMRRHERRTHADKHT